MYRYLLHADLCMQGVYSADFYVLIDVINYNCSIKLNVWLYPQQNEPRILIFLRSYFHP